MNRPLLLLLIALAGCGGRGSSFKEVEFRAPSQPDPALAPFLEEVDHIGVICVTNIEPFRELDIEKVMARLSNAVARGLGNMRETTVVPQDEITWQLKNIHFDSTSVYEDTVRAALPQLRRDSAAAAPANTEEAMEVEDAGEPVKIL